MASILGDYARVVCEARCEGTGYVSGAVYILTQWARLFQNRCIQY